MFHFISKQVMQGLCFKYPFLYTNQIRVRFYFFVPLIGGLRNFQLMLCVNNALFFNFLWVNLVAKISEFEAII